MASPSIALGAVSGMRTFGAWAGLAARGRIQDQRLRGVLLAAAAGELVGDKLPMIPPRGDPPSLAGRVISGALAGRWTGGAPGARAGAATAAASTYVSEHARALVGERLSLPDPVLGLLEDALVLGVAAWAARPVQVSEVEVSGVESAGNSSAEASAPAVESSAEASASAVESSAEASASAVESSAEASTPAVEATPAAPGAAAPASETGLATRVLRGLTAAAVGTAAMSAVQVAYLRATGGEPSSAPGDVGRKVIDVPRRHRPAFNQAMHFMYGTSWGAPFGLLRATERRGAGLMLGTAVWAVSLVELPLLGVAPPPWRQSPWALTSDLAFHLVYGTATAAVLNA